MIIFPSLSSGAVCQYPVKRTRRYRNITNTLEDDSRIVLKDIRADYTNWDLQYSGLSDAELGILQTFFENGQGKLNTFVFVDPASNLLVWSERLDQAAWQRTSLLQVQASIGDPLGTNRASRLVNNTSGQLSLVQTIPLPGDYHCCWSLYVRSDSSSTVALTRGAYSKSFLIGSSWKRVFVSTTTTEGNQSSDFGLTLTPGVSVDVFGMQVESQAAPSTYVQAFQLSGVYPSARFDSDIFESTIVAPNSNACRLAVVSRSSP
jgi:hypothetical protein